jgi:hypothetical protein
MLPPIETPDRVVTTREAWHTVAEHVLAAARYQAVGRIGLRAVGGGFGTPPYERDGVTEEILVIGDQLHVRRGEAESTHPLTTVAAAARAVGVEPGAPAHVYEPVTTLDPRAPLTVDLRGAHVLSSWFDLGWSALEELAAEHGDREPSELTVWPEHFDAAVELGDEVRGARGTFGASPGDAEHAEPYVYVTHWADVPDDPFWNNTAFGGSSLGYAALATEADPRAAVGAFFRRGLEVLSPRSE